MAHRQVATSTIQRVGLASIARSDAAAIDRVLRVVPGAHLQTNSRGETLVYLRGGGERQVAVFFDGALLNVPWDNRIDLSLVPTEMVGEIAVVKGPPPVVYGTNVMGGALNMTARSLEYPGRYTQATGMIGSYGARQVRAHHLQRTERLSFAAFSGYSERHSVGVPGGAELPFSQPDTGERTNTHRTMFSNYGQFVYHGAAGGRLGLSVLALTGEKGIAPEGHHDPAVARVRYWRYPRWRSTTTILSGMLPVGDRGMTIRGAAWLSYFGQSIEQYASAAYQDLRETQSDKDWTYGTRVSLYTPLSTGSVATAVSLLSSTHHQVDQRPDDRPAPPHTFQQRVFSIGSEYTRPGRIQFVAGASLDGVATPKTGDKPARGPDMTYSLMSGLSGNIAEGVRGRAVVGRKVRFPTMRELFGEALGRFLPNPDLGPEHSFLSEAGVAIDRAGITAEVVGFYNRTFETIDQRVVHLEHEDRPRRQRINLEGSSVLGLESTLSTRPWDRVALSCNLTAMRARAHSRGGGSTHLTEKPTMLGLCSSGFTSAGGWSVIAEYVLTGRAYGLLETGILEPLPRSGVLNTRVSYLFVHNSWAAEAFARVNNVTDAVTLPQLGLPGPGREFHAGMQVSF